MNTVPESLDTTPSLDELAKDAERMERRAHRRTLIVTLSMAGAAILIMSVWMRALTFYVDKGREQARIAQTTLAGVSNQVDQIQELLANGSLSAASAKKLLATTENTLGDLGNIQNNPQIQELQAQLLLTLSDVNLDTGNTSEALAQATKAKNIGLQLKTAGNAAASKLVYNARSRIGDLLSEQKDYAGAAEEYERALQIAEQSLKEKPHDFAWQTSLTLALMKIGDNKEDMNQHDAAENAYRDALNVATRNAESSNNNIEAQQSLARAHDRLGALFADRGDFAQALGDFKSALAIQKNIAEKQPSVANLYRYAVSLRRIGNVLSKQSDLQIASEHYERALDVLQRADSIDPTDVSVQTLLAKTQADLGDVSIRTAEYEKAKTHYQSALQLTEQLVTTKPDNVELQRLLKLIKEKVQKAKTESGEEKK